MNWTVENDAYRFLWIFVRGEHFDFASDGDSLTTFEEGGEWKNEFIIGAVGASPAMKANKANIFSMKFNAWLITNYPVKYEQGVVPQQAINNLANALATKEKLKDVGVDFDNVYLFPSEGA